MNNAGIIPVEQKLSEDDIDLVLQTNHFSHFLLSHLLKVFVFCMVKFQIRMMHFLKGLVQFRFQALDLDLNLVDLNPHPQSILIFFLCPLLLFIL